MSLYVSGLVNIDSGDHTDTCKRWVACTREEAERAGHWSSNGERYWRYDLGMPCTCLCGPLVYQGSHVLPSDDDERRGMVALCTIPGFISRPGRPALTDDDEDHPQHPWLRLMVADRAEEETVATVVLTRAHGREIRDALSEWLDRTQDSDVSP